MCTISFNKINYVFEGLLKELVYCLGVNIIFNRLCYLNNYILQKINHFVCKIISYFFQEIAYFDSDY